LLASLPPEQRQARLNELSLETRAHLRWHWPFWARPNQRLPLGDWDTWLILAGRGFGKTRTGAETIREWACGSTPLGRGTYGRFALVAETAADARDVMVEGDSGILRCHPRDFRPNYEPSKRRLTWPNGAVATVFNATEPDQLRGPQHDASWLDELAKWSYAQEAWDQLQFGLRLGLKPRSVITTTPRTIPVLREIIQAEGTFVTRGRTMDNEANLSPRFISRIHEKFAGTRLGRQELEAEMLEDVPGALWASSMIKIDKAPEMARVVVAVDPSGTKGGEGNDDVGIVVAGKGVDGRAYVLGDWTCNLSPAGWSRRVSEAYHQFRADRVVAEVNFGGAMVEAVIRASDPLLPVKLVNASRGKTARAEPIAALYEQGRVSHVQHFPELEDQLFSFTTNGYVGGGSPDRADALVWALTELALGQGGVDYRTLTKL